MSRIALLFALAPLAMTVPAMAMDAYASGPVELRAAPSEQGSPIAALAHGTKVDLQHCAGDWCLASAGGKVGWVREAQIHLRGNTR